MLLNSSLIVPTGKYHLRISCWHFDCSVGEDQMLRQHTMVIMSDNVGWNFLNSDWRGGGGGIKCLLSPKIVLHDLKSSKLQKIQSTISVWSLVQRYLHLRNITFPHSCTNLEQIWCWWSGWKAKRMKRCSIGWSIRNERLLRKQAWSRFLEPCECVAKVIWEQRRDTVKRRRPQLERMVKLMVKFKSDEKSHHKVMTTTGQLRIWASSLKCWVRPNWHIHEASGVCQHGYWWSAEHWSFRRLNLGKGEEFTSGEHTG